MWSYVSHLEKHFNSKNKISDFRVGLCSSDTFRLCLQISVTLRMVAVRGYVNYQRMLELCAPVQKDTDWCRMVNPVQVWCYRVWDCSNIIVCLNFGPVWVFWAESWESSSIHQSYLLKNWVHSCLEQLLDPYTQKETVIYKALPTLSWPLEREGLTTNLATTPNCM